MVDLSEHAILRRIDFLLSEARCNEPMITRDQAITFVMRVISNYCTIGKDAGSAEVKKSNKRMSKKAYELRKLMPLERWQKETINEHQYPLKAIWEWILENKNLSREDVYARFKRWRMVTITLDENKDLPKNCDDPIKRYENIEVGDLEGEIWKPLSADISDKAEKIM